MVMLEGKFVMAEPREQWRAARIEFYCVMCGAHGLWYIVLLLLRGGPLRTGIIRWLRTYEDSTWTHVT